MEINFHPIMPYVEKFESVLKAGFADMRNISKENLKPLEKDTFDSKIGKHKIPKYLYHLTPKENYSMMMEEGILDVGGEKDTIQGVFMFDLENFLKHWSPKNGTGDIRKRLLRYTSNFGSELVILKIPTEHLNKEELKIRSITHFNTKSEKEVNIAKEQWKTTGEAPKGFEHVILGDSAKKAGLYNQRKEALEYAYPDEIDMSIVKKVGVIPSYADLYIEELATGEDLLLKAFKHGFKNQPEEKALIMLENPVKN
jgi:hypothetical protein